MTHTVYDKNGNVKRIEDENGQTVLERVDRGKISDKSREELKTAIKNGNTEKRVEILEKIVFGKEIHQDGET